MKVTRSEPREVPSDSYECGNCRGTGLDGFGIMPDSFPCEGCDGKGIKRIDPNAKYIPLSEIIKRFKRQ